MSGLIGRLSSAFARTLRVSQEHASPPREYSPTGASPEQQREPSSRSATQDSTGGSGVKTLFKARGTLCSADASRVYKPLLEVDGAVFSITFDHEVYILLVQDLNGEDQCGQDIAEGMHLTYHYLEHCIMWPSVVGDEVVNFAFRFGGEEAEAATRKCVEMYNRALYCSLTHEPLPDTIDEDFAYMTAPLSAQEPMGEGSMEPAAEGEEEETFYDYEEELTSRQSTGGRGTNMCFADSLQFNRAIVLKDDGRGNCLVQAHTYTERGFNANDPGGVQEFRLEGITTQQLKGKDAMLLDHDHKLVFANAHDPSHGLTEVDLEQGRVVQQYQPGQGYKVQAACPGDKFGDQGSIITCMNRNSAFNIDTRLDPKQCAVVASGESLTSYTHTLRETQSFLCHAVSAEGHLAIGDMQGQVRLFSGPPGTKKGSGSGVHPKTAKTLLKLRSQERILHVDITSDGGYVLATCRRCVLVLSTTFTDDKGREQKGFETRMGKHKTEPILLDLSPAQIRGLGGMSHVEFTKAVFETTHSGEHWVVASVGSHIATWNFAAVKKAMSSRQRVEGTVKNEKSVVRSVVMSSGGGAGGGGSPNVKFLTDNEVGMETRTSSRRSKVYSRFQ